MAVLLLSMAPDVYGAEDSGQDSLPFSDIKGHWAEKTITEHARKGFLKGYPDGTFRPDQGMRRCELVALINRYFGLVQQGDENFADVKGTEWYAPDTARARYYGYLEGLKARPEEFATRENVVEMVSLLLDLAEQEQINEGIDFSDIGNLDEGTKENVLSFSQMGYLQGYPDGTFKPDRIINRAEIMTIAQNVLGYIVTSQEDLENIPEDVKKITIIKPDISIKDKTIAANLYITPGVVGNITIQNSTIKGKLEIGGGSADRPVVLENVTADKVLITKAKGEPRLEIKSSDIGELKIKSTTKIDTDNETTISEARISAGTEISGEGKIQKAYIDSDNVKLERKPDYTEILSKDIVADIGGKEISQSNDDKGSSTRSKSSSGSSSGNQTPQLIPITSVEITGTATVGEAVYAEVSPEAATVIYQWQRSSDGTEYDAIEGAAEPSYVLTEEDEGKQIRVTAKGTGNYTGTAASSSIGPIDPFLIAITSVEITGAATVGEAVYAEVSPLDATVTYQWQRGKRITEFADIAGATGPSYTLTEDDHDLMVRVVVNGTGRYTGTAVSDAIEPAWDPVTAKINEGWIPIANKQELKQIEIASDNTFGAGTKWEGTYTGGMDKKYMLVADIDLAGDNFIPIGYDEVADTASDFTGALSGEGYAIQNLTISRDRELQGLFSCLGSGALITGVRLENASVTAKSRFGALAGESQGAMIEDCAVSGVNLDVSSKAADLDYANRYIGGLIGKSTGTRYSRCLVENLAMVVHEPEFNSYFLRNVGGVTGLLDGGSISDTRADGIHIELVNHFPGYMSAIFASGGLAGELQNTSDETLTVNNCTVSGLELIAGATIMLSDNGTGGLIGVADTVNSGVPTNGDIVIKNSGASGLIQGKGSDSATEKVGGFIGYADGTNAPSGYITIENCTASVDISKLDINPSYLDVYIQNGPAGGFASKLIKTQVTNSYAYGDLDSAFLAGGGFAGWIVDSQIDLCGAEGDVLGNTFMGGFALRIANSEVTRCYASGLVGGSDAPEQSGILPSNIGGFAFIISGGTLRDNYFAGQMEESDDYGGAFNGMGWGAGFVELAINAVIQNAYVSGNVANNVGFAFQITGSETDISGCYWNSTATPSSSAVYDNSSGVAVGIEAKTDAELKQIATFEHWNISEEGAGENTLWLIKEGEKYPYFNPDYVPSR